jgi:hypothetical protein
MFLTQIDPAFIAGESGSTPSLDLFFSATKALDPRITFTRASTGTFINSAGLVESAASGVARFTHDPVTLASLGLLVEEARTNLLMRSDDLTATWSGVGITISANAATAPDGAQIADSVTASSSGSAVRYVVQSVSKAASAIQYSYSLFVKPIAGGRYITFSVDDGGGNGFSGGLDTTTGTTTGGTVGPGGAFSSVSATQHVNGWWRVTLVGTSTNVTTVRVAVNLAASLTTGYPSANLNAGDGMFIWGLQLEAGAFATSYIPTTSATVTRAADVATMTGTNFSSWYNASEGTFAVNYRPVRLGAYQQILQVDDGTLNNRAPSLAQHSTNVGRVDWSANGANQINSLGSGLVTLSDNKVAASYKIGSGASVSTNGSVSSSTFAITTPTATQLYIGDRSAISAALNAPIARIRYYRRRLPNAALQTLTT